MAILVFWWFGSLAGCGFVELLDRTRPVDTAAEAAKVRCEEGLSAYCTCRSLANPIEDCSDAVFDATVDACAEGESAVAERTECWRSLRDGNDIQCVNALNICGPIPLLEPEPGTP